MTAATATFELERFTADDDGFELSGRWRAEEQASLGRARLVVEVDGRRRRLSAQPAAAIKAGPVGRAWSARFPLPGGMGEVASAELEVGRELVVDLPEPEIAAPRVDTNGHEPPAAAPAPEPNAELEEARRTIAELRAAREEAAAEVERLREALADARSAPDPVPPSHLPDPSTPRRAEIRAALERPREPKGVFEGAQPEKVQTLAYAIGGGLLLFLILLLIVLL